MPEPKKTKICDPLYGYIYLDRAEARVINSPAFQRLRGLHQLGFSERAFPSGTGRRFSHSLGVCHLAGEAFDSLFEKNKSLPLSEAKKKEFRRTVRLAALLHDIGHGPLSHSSEPLMPPVKNLRLEKYLKTEGERPALHEDYGVKFIMEEPGLNKILREEGFEPQAAARLLHGEFSGAEDFFIEGGLNFLPLLRQIISSDFDVDRMDYMQRDSLFCGVKYGLVDFLWLISHFDCHVEEGRVFLAIRKGGLYTIESFILGRQHMRLIVYFHHKPVIYDQMLKKYSEESAWRLPSKIEEYMHWTDEALFHKLKSDSDKSLWAERIVKRRPYLRLYENSFFLNSEKEDSLKGQSPGALKSSGPLQSLKEALAKEEIDFIEINSQKNAFRDYKKSFKKYSIFLKEPGSAKAGLLYDSPALLPLPIRNIQRIYTAPEDFSRAEKALKKLLA